MTEDSNQHVNVDEIVRQIRAEVAKRKAEQLHRPAPIDAYPRVSTSDDREFSASAAQEAALYRFAKRIQGLLKRYPSYNRINSFAKRFAKHIPQFRESVLADLISHHDRDFVQLAYLTILKREADSHGFDSNLSRLRNGQLSKIELLGRLRYSAEGRRKRVKIKGLRARFVLQVIFRIPVFGYVLRLIATLLRLPVLAGNIQKFEALTNARFSQYEDLYSRELQRLSGVLHKSIREQTIAITGLQNSLRTLLDEVADRSSGALSEEERNAFAAEKEHLLDALYVVFEDRFRGSREEIKGRVREYLGLVAAVKAAAVDGPVLDIGCGRGEWLELLREQGYAARGVDRNRIMVSECRTRGLDAVAGEAVDYLKSQEGEAFAAITGFHLVEHLPFDALIRLLDEALRGLKPGGVAVFETPNPENLVVGACNFYSDPTHRHPLPPALLSFLLESRGFENIEIKRLHPNEYFLNSPGEHGCSEKIQALFTNAQDYCAIAYKPKSVEGK